MLLGAGGVSGIWLRSSIGISLSGFSVADGWLVAMASPDTFSSLAVTVAFSLSEVSASAEISLGQAVPTKHEKKVYRQLIKRAAEILANLGFLTLTSPFSGLIVC